MPTENFADDLMSSILGAADPGTDGKNDEGTTGPVGDNDPDLDPDNGDNGDNGQDQETDQEQNDELAAGDDVDPDEDGDPLAREARRGRPPKEDQEEQPLENQDDRETDIFSPSAKIKTDRAGNVVFNGKVIAKAGREARLYMGWRKTAVRDREAADQLATRTAQVAGVAQELNIRYNALKEQKTLFDTAGLSAEEQSQLLPIAIAYKKDPVAGIKLLLTRAHMAGVDIKSLGGGGGIDPKVLMDDMRGHLAELLKPVREQTTISAHQEKLREEVTGFFQRNPRAKDVSRALGGSHKLGAILKEAKQRSPDLSLDDLFARLDYALLQRFGGKLPTGPVEKRPAPNPRRTERKMERNLRSTVSKQNPSFDDIAQSVLRDAQALNDAANSRSF